MDSDVHDVTTALVQRYIEAAQRLTRGRFQIRQNYKGNDAKTESCNQNQCSGPILEKKIFLPI